jgi:bacterioferritin-associated ferredoxin
MIICSCEVISHRVIEREIDAGAGTVRELGRRCGAGTDCGSCGRRLAEMIERRRARRDRPHLKLVVNAR